MSELENLPEKVVSLIPYFYYDLFSRILPGFFLTFGLFLAFHDKKQVKDLIEGAKGARTAEWVVGCAVLVAACFLVGFLLGQLGRLLWLRFKIPVSLADLRDQFGSTATAESSLEVAFRTHFGFGLNHNTEKKTYLVYCSRLCELAVASRHPALDAVSVRIASEELLSRSLLFAGVILLSVSGIRQQWWACGAYIVIASLALRSFIHYREEGIRERFQMFLILWRTKELV